MEKETYIRGQHTLFPKAYTEPELVDHLYEKVKEKYAKKTIDLSKNKEANWMESSSDGIHQNDHYYYNHPSAALCSIDKNEWLMIRGFYSERFPVSNNITFYNSKGALRSLNKDELIKSVIKTIKGRNRYAEKVIIEDNTFRKCIKASSTNPLRNETLYWLLKYNNTKFIMDTDGKMQQQKSDKIALDEYKVTKNSLDIKNVQEYVEQKYKDAWRLKILLRPEKLFPENTLNRFVSTTEIALTDQGLKPKTFKKALPFKTLSPNRL